MIYELVPAGPGRNPETKAGFSEPTALRLRKALAVASSSPFFGKNPSMQSISKPYVHLAIDSVDLVVHDPLGRYDADRYDRYASFTEARDAALTCIEAMLDEADYEDELHRSELEFMLGLLEPATSFDEDLMTQPDYRSFLERLEPTPSMAA